MGGGKYITGRFWFEAAHIVCETKLRVFGAVDINGKHKQTKSLNTEEKMNIK